MCSLCEGCNKTGDRIRPLEVGQKRCRFSYLCGAIGVETLRLSVAARSLQKGKIQAQDRWMPNRRIRS